MLRSFSRNRDGNFAIMTVIAAVPLLAAVAGMIDYSSVRNKAGMVQNALDAAGIAIAQEYRSGASQEELNSLGEKTFLSNLRWHGSKPSFFYASQEETAGKITIEVRSSFNHDGLIGWDFWKVDRSSVLSISPHQPGCMLALHPTAPAAIKMTGSTSVELKRCLLAANSTASNAISRTGAASLHAECAVAVGATSGLNSRTRLDCEAPLHNQQPSPDPLAYLSPPDPGTTCRKLPTDNPKLLSPGTYCGETLWGNIELKPGNYILRGGGIDLGGGGSLAGKNVTIFLMEGAYITLTSNQVATLDPPKTGPYAGIVIFQDRDNNNDLTLTGGTGTTLTGFVYAPAATVLFRGNSEMAGADKCIRIVASTIDLSGKSSLSLDCDTELAYRKLRVGQQSPILVR